MRFFRGLVIVLAVLFVTGCASLRGIPQGLNELDEDKKEGLAKDDLKEILKVADNLSSKYKEARNDNLNYAFWSNMAFIPAAAAAAGGIYFKASTDVLAGVGIFTGTLAGVNTSINAKSNAAVYQSGMNALGCTQTALIKFTGPSYPDAIEELRKRVETLDGEIDKSQKFLTKTKEFNFSAAEALAEITKNATAIADFAAAQKDLSDALAKAATVSVSGHSELAAFATIKDFARGAIRTVDQQVTAKVTQPDVDFATQRDKITASITGSIAAKTKAGDKMNISMRDATVKLDLGKPKTPIADAEKKMTDTANALVRAASDVSEQIKQTGVVDAETAATNCQKKN